MAATTTKTLDMVFTDEGGNSVSVNLSNVDPAVTADKVKTAMQAIITNKVVMGKNGLNLKAIKSAAIVATSKTGVVIV